MLCFEHNSPNKTCHVSSGIDSMSIFIYLFKIFIKIITSNGIHINFNFYFIRFDVLHFISQLNQLLCVIFHDLTLADIGEFVSPKSE